MKIMLKNIPDNTGIRTKTPFIGDKNTMEEIRSTAAKAHRVEVSCSFSILSENFMLIIG